LPARLLDFVQQGTSCFGQCAGWAPTETGSYCLALWVGRLGEVLLLCFECFAGGR